MREREQRIGGTVTGLGVCFSPRLQRQARQAMHHCDELTVGANLEVDRARQKRERHERRERKRLGIPEPKILSRK